MRQQKMSRRDFTWFGIFDQAYIKPVVVDGVTVYAVHAANGHLMVRLDNLSDAGNVVRQEFVMEALSVH